MYSRLHKLTITSLSSRFYPSNNHFSSVLLHHMLCCWFSFMFVLLPCSIQKKSRVIKFWGFFMYLLFLGIVQNNTMKLDDALTQIGKLFLGKILSDVICFSQLLTEGVQLKRDHWLSEFSASATIKIPNWNCFILSSFIVPNLGTPFRLKRIETRK